MTIQFPIFTPGAVAFVAPSVQIVSGHTAGQIADAHGMVGLLIAPANGAVRVQIDGQPWAFVAGALDVNADAFVTGDDYDLWMAAWQVGYVGCDYDQNGFVNGEDEDAFVAAFVAGVP